MKKILLVLFFLSSSILVYAQCTATITSSGTAICSGNPVVLTANPANGGGPYNYAWSTGESTQTITVNKIGTYTVFITNASNCTATASQTITEAPIPDAPIVPSANVNACPNTSTTLTVTGPGGTYQWYDESGVFKGSGPNFTTDIITARTVYYVETTLNGCTSGRTQVTVFPIGGPIGTGATTCPGGSVTLTATGAGSYEWYDAPSGGTRVGAGPSFTTPALTATKIYYVVGITQGCASTPTAVQAIVNAAPAAPTYTAPAVCAGQTTNVHASSTTPGATFNWYTVPSGGTPFISSPDYTTGILNSSVTYYVEAVSPEGCIGPRTAVPILVNAIPAAPSAQQVGTACSGGTATLAATGPGGSYTWYDTETSLFPLFTGDTFTTPVLNASRTYYVQVTSAGGCVSATRTLVNVTVNPTPVAPIVSGQTICSGNSAILTPVGPGGTYEWFDAATAGNLLYSGAAGFTTPVLNATTTYYVQSTINGCTSTTRTAVTVTVNTTPASPVSGGDQTICMGQTATLTATGAGSNYQWYDAITGGNLLATTQSFTTPALMAGATYYVQSSNGTCSSVRVAVNVKVDPLPSPPAASGTTICAGTSATLTATGGAGVFNWYNVATGGTVLATGSSFTTPNLAATTTYYVALTNGGCSSTRTAVTVTVTSTLNQFEYSSGTYCKGASNPSPTISVPGGTFSAPAGLVINAGTGEINLAATVVGTYNITYTNGCVISSRRVSVVIIPDPAFSYAAPAYCRGSGNVSAIFTPTSSGGTFTASPSGLIFSDVNRGTINMTASAPGTYTITNTIDGIAGCATVVASTTLRIDPQVVVNAGPDQALATGVNAQLAGSVSGSATTGTWSGGTGTFNNANALNAIYTPGVGETSATLTLTSANPGTTCGPVADQVVLTFSPKPSQPTVSPVAAICAGNSATLVATGPGGTYRWYDASVGGTLLSTGATYTTSPLIANTTFYVSTTIASVTSDRTPVPVIVNPVPVAPAIAPIGPVCAGNRATLVASGPAGTYEWFTVPIGGSVQFTGSTYTTLPLTVNTTFYVQVVANGCASPREPVLVTVNPVPRVTSATTGNICSGVAQNYTITADLAGTTFSWSRAAVADISNPAESGQTTTAITEALINTSGSIKTVVYNITPILNGCSGVPFNYRVTVYPTSRVTSPATTVVCSGTAVNYQILFNTGSVFSWSRAAVTNISNAAVSGQTSQTINEALVNTSNAPVDVTYVIDHKTATCDGSRFLLTVTVNPRVTFSGPNTGEACGGVAQNFVIASRSNVPGATYSWSRAATPGISEPAVINNTNGVIDEVLTNTTNSPVEVTYNINTVANGCQIAPFVYKVMVNPQPAVPIVNSNSPVCIGNSLKLFSSRPYVGAPTWSWSGPNGYTSSAQNPVIDNVTSANAGTYTLVVTINGCASVSSSVTVSTNAPSIANAGADQTVCPSVTAVNVAGTITGGGTTGLWKTLGTGTFNKPADELANIYTPSAADVAAGSVRLTLTSTSTDDCTPSVDELLVTFGTVPATDAGPNVSVCPQFPVALNGKMLVPVNGTWTTSGSGMFYYGGSPNSTQLNGMPSPEYRPSAADIAAGSVKLMLTANTTDPCYITADTMTVAFVPAPSVNAGGTRYVAEGKTIVLNPIVGDENVTYAWTLPNGSAPTGLSPANVKEPTVTGVADVTYRLTITDSRGCTSYSDVLVKVAIEVVAPNTFTPNNDGVNDLWDIKGLVAYEEARIDIFNRYGQKVYSSIGYNKPWDGTQNGKPLPVGTYYYIIDTRMLGMRYSGYVALLR